MYSTYCSNDLPFYKFFDHHSLILQDRVRKLIYNHYLTCLHELSGCIRHSFEGFETHPKNVRDFEIPRFHVRFPDFHWDFKISRRISRFPLDFKISCKISKFDVRFQDFSQDFKISSRISGFHLRFLDFTNLLDEISLSSMAYVSD